MRDLKTCVTLCAALLSSGALGFDARTIREGDKLKITFFETMELPDVPGLERGSKDAKMRVFYQRLDLSGDYAVDVGGAISIPVVGSVGAAGKSAEQVRDGVLAALEKTTGRRSNASVAIVQRQPVFVTGAVRHPGSYPYNSGMIAIQALALAGGPDRVEFGQMLGLMERKDQTDLVRDRMARALARKAILTAARDGGRSAAPPPRLVELAGQDVAKDIFAQERKAVETRLEEKQADLAQKQQAAVATREEVSAIQGRLADLERQLAARHDRLQKMESLLAKQVVSDERVAETRRDLLDLQGRKSDYKVSLVQIQNRAAQLEAEVKNAETARRTEADAELSQLDQQIAQGERSVRAGEKALGLAAQRLNATESSQRLKIIRVESSGTRIFDADETTELAPGDVVMLGEEPGVSATPLLSGRASASVK
jgi:protein involved in polysaccharide export with SLBB domain